MPLPIVTVEPCAEEERDFLADLWATYKQAERDVQIAWSAFCRAHGLPLASELEGVTKTGLLVKRPPEAESG